MATVLDIATPDTHAAPRTDAPGVAVPAGKTSLVGLTRAELQDRLLSLGVGDREARMRVAQLWHWIYFRGATRFDEMTNVGKGLRAALASAYTLARPEVVSEQVSKDGARKWLIRMPSTGPLDRGA